MKTYLAPESSKVFQRSILGRSSVTEPVSRYVVDPVFDLEPQKYGPKAISDQ